MQAPQPLRCPDAGRHRRPHRSGERRAAIARDALARRVGIYESSQPTLRGTKGPAAADAASSSRRSPSTPSPGHAQDMVTVLTRQRRRRSARLTARRQIRRPANRTGGSGWRDRHRHIGWFGHGSRSSQLRFVGVLNKTASIGCSRVGNNLTDHYRFPSITQEKWWH